MYFNHHKHWDLHSSLILPKTHSMDDPKLRPSSTQHLLITRWAPVVFYCSIIVYLSSQSYPDLHIPSFLSGVSDKLVHAIEYGILGILLYRALYQRERTIGRIGLAIIGAVAFGISDEIHQWFVPQRHADIWDIVADSLGAAFFIFIWVFITEKFGLRNTPHEVRRK